MAILLLGVSIAGAQNLVFTINSALSNVHQSSDDIILPASDSPTGQPLPLQIASQFSNAHPWAAGSNAPIMGTIGTTYNGTSIQFNGGVNNNIVGIPTNAGVPNAAAWNPTLADGFGNTGTYSPQFAVGLHTYAAEGYAPTLSSPVAYVAYDNVHFDVNSSAAIPIVGTTFDTSASNFGASLADLLLQSEIKSTFGDAYDPAVNVAAADVQVNNLVNAGTLVVLGNLVTLTYQFQTNFTNFVGSVPFPSHLDGTIVATAIIPEPSSLVLAGMGLIPLALCVRRKFRGR
jgi:hypothetical protein